VDWADDTLWNDEEDRDVKSECEDDVVLVVKMK
jgi:hypothetical protein